MAVDSLSPLTISFEQTHRLREAVQRSILKRPSSMRQKVRRHWQRIKAEIADGESTSHLFSVFPDLMDNRPTILFSGLDDPIVAEQYVRELPPKEQQRAREYWSQHL